MSYNAFYITKCLLDNAHNSLYHSGSSRDNTQELIMKRYRVTRVNDKIAVVIYSKTRKVLHQGFITVADIDRLLPLFSRYMNKTEVAALVAEIKVA